MLRGVKKRITFLPVLFVVSGLLLSSHLVFDEQTKSANLTSVSTTISNARPSFRGALAAGNSVGSSSITINTTMNAYPSTSSAQLVEGDILRIGSGGVMTTAHTARSFPSLSVFTVDTVLPAGNADVGDDVIATVSSTLTNRFTTTNAVANGAFRILVPAVANSPSGAPQDGVPDGGGFDFAITPPTVTCPADVSLDVYDFVTGTATASYTTISGVNYHSFECRYSGIGGVGTAFNGSSQGAITVGTLINPAPATGHTAGVADSYSVIIQHLDSTYSVVDRTTVKIGVIEAVRISASVAPQITFKILPVAAATSVCGISTDVASTATTVPFGDLGLTVFTEAAQSLTVTTNATSGFAVTAIQNDQMGRGGGTCTGAPSVASNPDCIPDAEVASMTQTTSQDWTLTTNKGMAYTLHDANTTTTEAFAYNESARAFSARHFADEEAAETATTIFSATSVADNDNLYVCYRVIPDTTTAAGDYENYVRYTATATF